MLMVKPGFAYLDLVRETKNTIRIFEEPALEEKALHVITQQTADIMQEISWEEEKEEEEEEEEEDKSVLVTVLSRDCLSAPESLLFEVMDR